jgi:prepilin-type N-terminal cleavage/methylation domain-containing protein
MRRRSGFTLIELMIVLAIIAALAAILTPMGLNALNRAKATQYVADVRNIRAAAQVYYFDKNSIPQTVTFATLDGYINANELSIASADYALAGANGGGNQLTVTISNMQEGVEAQMGNVWQDRTAPYDDTNNQFVFTF